jgi:Phytanoyl-CoA dioxygenase (PhyH)
VHIPTNFKLSAFNNDSIYKSDLYDAVCESLAARLEEILPDYVPLVVNVFEKRPHSGFDPVPIHQNPSFVAEPESKSVSIWIPLQDVRKENGTVGVFKGSHNKFNRMRAGNMPHEEIFEHVSRTLEEKYFEPLILRAGEIGILDDSIIHWSYPNVSDELRVAVQLIMVPREAPHIYYYYNQSGKTPMMDLYEVDKTFFFNFNCKDLPVGLKKITSVPYEYKEITESELSTCVLVR